jgi:DNA helicase-2/ATP-dependent DNA helicase PcrA
VDKIKTNFQTEYDRLNPEQKTAVDTIEGPVMVIAGAGTGKTQTIALRIGNILQKTQTPPSSILCLTFTESAAINMRQRLIALIGASAYSIRVSTFHSFCNSVIREHPERFLFSKKESTSLDDVKRIQIIRTLIDQLPAGSALTSFNAPYYWQRDIISSLQDLKKENVTPENFSELIKYAADFVSNSNGAYDQLSKIRATEKASGELAGIVEKLAENVHIHPLYQSRVNLYLTLFKQGDTSLSDLKKNIRDLIEKTKNNLPRLNDLLTIYRGYQQALLDQNLFDYDDMILWVLAAFRNNQELLAEYQEKYQYLLVDEFQDTNSSQFEILNLLSSHQSEPNLFVVGDDDQSIYRFQGASVENIYNFYQRYQAGIRVIVLKNNYRSHKLILESSDCVIKNNLVRITQYIKNLDKSLVSTKTFDPDPINLGIYTSPEDEVINVVQKIKSLIGDGVSPKEIAVLFRNNADIQDFLPAFDQQGVKYLLSDNIDILKSREIQQLIDLMKFIVNPHDDHTLGQILSFNFLKIDPFDLYRLYHYTGRHDLSVSEFILDKNNLLSLKIKPYTIRQLRNFVIRVAKTRQKSGNLPLDHLFNEIIRRFRLLKYILDQRRVDLLKQLNVLFSLIKSRLQNESTYTLEQFVEELDLLRENQINLNSQPLLVDIDKSVRLMTVHKAKGLEFEHVFLVKVVSGKWDSSSSRNLIKLPLGIVKTDITQVTGDQDLEEDRRLFYVALTRAKKQIYISLSRRTETGREQLPSVFVSEINPSLLEKFESTAESEAHSLRSQYSVSFPKLKSINLSDYLRNYLSTSYRFNITHLNSYLNCPLCFFFKTILRLPSPKTRSLSMGTSVHGSLAYLFQVYKEDNRLISLDKFKEIYKNNLQREHLPKKDHRQVLAAGLQILTDYYNHYQTEFNGNCFTEHDFRFHGIRLNGIPITGKIDKIDIIDKNHVNVVDFKTGKPDNKYGELSRDGDYFRQLVFYKILCENSATFPYKVTQGTIDFIEKTKSGEFKRVTFEITSDDVNNLTQLIAETYAKIADLEFIPSRTCRDPDHVHYLFDQYFL